MTATGGVTCYPLGVGLGLQLNNAKYKIELYAPGTGRVTISGDVGVGPASKHVSVTFNL